MLRTKDQNKRLHALIGQLQLDADTKAELVYEFTGGRTDSSSKMIVNECASLITYLTNLAEKPNGHNIPGDKQRKKILSICHEMNWYLAGTTQLDWPRINQWVLKYGYLHKDLKSYSPSELPGLVTQFEFLLKSYYAKR